MPEILWTPPPLPENHSRMAEFLRFAERTHHCTFSDYHSLHRWSVAAPEAFWKTFCDFIGVTFDTPAERVLDAEKGMFGARWFNGASLSFARHLLSRNDEHLAIIAINEQGAREEISFRELNQRVAECAAALRMAGVTRGARVAAILPNSPFAVIAMLATASLGGVWSSCSPDFGVNATIDRLGQAEPVVLFVEDGHVWQGKTHESLEKIPQYLQALKGLATVVVCPVLGLPASIEANGRATSWNAFLRPAEALDVTPYPFDHPLYLLFSSGTTGRPKGIVHGAGGTLLQHLKELALHTDLRAEDRLFFYTTTGWMMWNWMVSALALGTTLVLYDGAPTWPDANRLFDIIDAENISVFGTSAKFLSVVEKSGLRPNEKHPLKHLRTILSTGSPLLPANYDFTSAHIKATIPLCSISGGTDIVSCFALSNPLLPVRRGELQAPGLGMAVEVFNEEGQSVREMRGELVCTRPFPSMPVSFWNDADGRRYHQAYFERFSGVWAHGDYAEITRNGGLIIYGRSDAILNPGGVRIGTAEIYRQIESIPEIVDSVVIAQEWEDDVRIVLFVKLKPGITLDESLCQTIRTTLRTNASPRHVPAKILEVPDIPRTLSGKTVELAVREAVHGRPVINEDALANPEALAFFKNRKELQPQPQGAIQPTGN
ncbi:acetoacetate--CoA ligase [Legionella geestiana]|nr:acetoacetate--CoA ligase [Legionella geestiana]QBS11751.1 acetoacetate--CoA ligase [Legionella geestiana]QDQ40637.1 acetoacetate--CoA ligase [Legionella geestiana]STX53558.1 acetyl-CoA synthetase [Legionella geestiana]